MKTYRPIPCADHERLEFAALTRQWLELVVDAGEGPERMQLLPLDVYTRDGEEWLHAQTEAGEARRLRLDWLQF